MMKGFATSHGRRGVIRSYAEPFPFHNYMYESYASRAGIKKPTNNHKIVFVFSVLRNSELYKIASGIGLEELKAAMVGERIRREPWGESES